MKPWEHVARGLCKASGCLCSQKQCTAPDIYADMAIAAMLELEKAGYIFLPPIGETENANKTDGPRPSRLADLVAELGG